MDSEFTVSLERRERYRFDVRFDGMDYPGLGTDESTPPGDGRAPNPTRLLAAALGSCLGSSLLFCLERSHAEVEGMRARVRTRLARNEQGRWRVERVAVDLETDVRGEDAARRLARCRGMFEEFCIVTGSVRRGIPVDVRVLADGVPVASAIEGEGRPG